MFETLNYLKGLHHLFRKIKGLENLTILHETRQSDPNALHRVLLKGL